MPVIVIANPKGGAGKSTLSTNVAGYFASLGHAVMLGDADVQQSSRLWLSLRPDTVNRITTWEMQADLVLTAKPPRGTTHVVIDTPGGLDGWRFKEVLSRADKIMVPIMPSIFDMYAAQNFLTKLREITRHSRSKVGVVGMRVDERTLAVSTKSACNSQVVMRVTVSGRRLSHKREDCCTSASPSMTAWP